MYFMRLTDLREGAILSGMFLSKFGKEGLLCLGLKTYKEAYTIFGLAFNVAPASIKNYRDEFDSVFPNERQGWHKREMRDYVARVYRMASDIDMTSAVFLLAEIAEFELPDDCFLSKNTKSVTSPDLALNQRGITGKAAENYFIANYREFSAFRECSICDVTSTGCGFDFKLEGKNRRSADYLAVEVKGLNSSKGQLSMTSREYITADKLASRYFLYVVRNFAETPSILVYNDPVGSGLPFVRRSATVTNTYFSLSV